jgi:hypothetical protein
MGHKVMHDPVTTVDGFTFERAAIQDWWRRGRITSPLTGADLHATTLVANRALKQAIEEFLDQRSAAGLARSFRIPFAELTLERELGRGNFKVAWHTRWKGQPVVALQLPRSAVGVEAAILAQVW